MHVRHTWPLRSGKQKSVCSYSGLNRVISELMFYCMKIRIPGPGQILYFNIAQGPHIW